MRNSQAISFVYGNANKISYKIYNDLKCTNNSVVKTKHVNFGTKSFHGPYQIQCLLSTL